MRLNKFDRQYNSMKYLPLVFALGTAICWGCYGPVIGKVPPEYKKAAGVPQSPFKAYVFIGIAYLVLAVAGGLVMMKIRGDSFQFFGPASRGTMFSFAAGSLGALGALSLTTAMFLGGLKFPHVVMCFVFGGAATIAALVTIFVVGVDEKPKPMLWVGIVGMVACALIVAANTPHAHPPGAKHPPEKKADS